MSKRYLKTRLFSAVLVGLAFILFGCSVTTTTLFCVPAIDPTRNLMFTYCTSDVTEILKRMPPPEIPELKEDEKT